MTRVLALLSVLALVACGADGAPQSLVEKDTTGTIGVDGSL